VISTLRGTITGQTPQGVVVDVGGVGFLCLVPQRTLHQLGVGEDTQLFTTLVVREDDMTLFGFAVEEDRILFELLRSVNGVGPKSALGILSELSAAEIADAIVTENDRAFVAVSGIGPKTGKLIVVSLQGKIAHLAGAHPRTRAPGDTPVSAAQRHDIVQALVGLGWSERVAGDAVDQIVQGLAEGERPGVTDLIRRALALLGPATVREEPS
jgi:holliday junction DNA helicase RuvA